MGKFVLPYFLLKLLPGRNADGQRAEIILRGPHKEAVHKSVATLHRILEMHIGKKYIFGTILIKAAQIVEY